MALPQPTKNQPYCIVSALEAGDIFLDPVMFIDDATSGQAFWSPSLSFLLQHSTSKKRLVFDLGIRKDWENLSPKTVENIREIFKVNIQQDVIDSLAKGGLSPLDIDTVCLSHVHWDHSGYALPFEHSEFIVGGDTSKLFEDGLWPHNPDAFFSADIIPTERTKFLGDDINWEQLGPFPRAYDLYGDGSLYIIDAPGHLRGHIDLLVRTNPEGAWIYLAGDTAHHWDLITGSSAIACGHSGECAHQFKELAEQTIEHVRKVMEIPRVRVILAHDKPWYDENKGSPAFFPGKIESL